MKSVLLFIGYDSKTEVEIREYIRGKTSKVFFVQTPVQAIRVIDDHEVDCVVLNFFNLSDAAVLRYISQYRPNSRIVLSASKEFDEIISFFSQQPITRIPKPFRMEELSRIIG
jgi:DNA-binding NtrC family response regulator